MIKEEHIKKLSEITNISLDEAKFTLNKNNDDIIDSLLFLEMNGRIRNSNVSYFNTKNYKASEYLGSDNTNNQNYHNDSNEYKSIQDKINDLIDKGNRNYICIYIKNTKPIRLPVISIIVLILATCGFLLPIAYIALYLNVKYRCIGSDMSEDSKINIFFEKIEKKIARKKHKRR